MGVTKAITLRLEPADYERLEAEARRLGMTPGTLARVYVRAGLSGGKTRAEQNYRPGLAALEHLAVLRAELRQAGYPSVDAVELAQESRAELERRSSP
jgi:hypothetical protein